MTARATTRPSRRRNPARTRGGIRTPIEGNAQAHCADGADQTADDHRRSSPALVGDQSTEQLTERHPEEERGHGQPDQGGLGLPGRPCPGGRRGCTCRWRTAAPHSPGELQDRAVVMLAIRRPATAGRHVSRGRRSRAPRSPRPRLPAIADEGDVDGVVVVGLVGRTVDERHGEGEGELALRAHLAQLPELLHPRDVGQGDCRGEELALGVRPGRVLEAERHGVLDRGGHDGTISPSPGFTSRTFSI